MNTNSLSLSLSDDLDKIGRLDALNGIREALWAINARNILRSIVEEVAGESTEEDDEDDGMFSSLKNKQEVDKDTIDIEVVDGLNLHVKYAYNRRNRAFAAVVDNMVLETNDKVFTFSEKFALEMNVDVVNGTNLSATQTFNEFVEQHQNLANATPMGGNESQIDILIDLLFDFTDIESVW